MSETRDSWLLRLWRTLVSRRFAVVVIGLWALLCAVGLILPASAGFDIFHSFLVPLLAALLALSLATCMLQRWLTWNKRISSSAAGTRAAGEPNTGARTSAAPARISLVSGISAEEGLQHLTVLLSGRHYAVHNHTTGALRAERNRLSRYASPLIHVSLLGLIVAVSVAGMTGFKENYLPIVEGQQMEIEHGTGLAVTLDKFNVDYWPNGTPKEYLSAVEVTQPNGSTRKADITVNHPLNVNGVRLFQTAYGSAPRVSFSSNGKTVTEGAIPLESVFSRNGGSWPAGTVDLTSLGLVAWVIGHAGTGDPMLDWNQVLVEIARPDGSDPIGQAIVTLGQPAVIGGVNVNFEKAASFSAFSVSKEPARPAIWATAGLFILGLLGALWFPHTSITIRAGGHGAEETEHLALAVTRPAGRTRQKRAIALAAQLEAALRQEPPARGKQGR